MSRPLRVALRIGVGGDVDVGVGAGQRVELDGGHRAEGAFAGFTAAVGEVEHDAVVVDGDEGGAFDGLVAGQIGKCHASNLVGWHRQVARRATVTGAVPEASPGRCRCRSRTSSTGSTSEIAMPVKNAAMSGEMPLFPTLDATQANDLPGSTSIGTHGLAQWRWPRCRIVVADAGVVQCGEESVVDRVGVCRCRRQRSIRRRGANQGH